jgi:hypothetical protein
MQYIITCNCKITYAGDVFDSDLAAGNDMVYIFLNVYI